MEMYKKMRKNGNGKEENRKMRKNGKKMKKRRRKMKNVSGKRTEKTEDFFPLSFRKPMKLFRGLPKWIFLPGKS